MNAQCSTTTTEWLLTARDEFVMDVFNVSCLFSWSPSTRGSRLSLNYTHNSRQSEIISHFLPGTCLVRSGVGPVWSGVARCGPVRLIVTPQRQVAADIWTKPMFSHKPSFRLLVELHSPSPLLLLSPKTDTHFTIPRRVEGWVDLHGDWLHKVHTKMVYPPASK